MGKRSMVLIFIILFVLSATVSTIEGAESISSPSNVNQIITDFSDLDLKPGEDEEFSFRFYNPYTSPMRNITMVIEIYRFSNFEESVTVSEIENPIYFDSTDRTSVDIEKKEKASGNSQKLSFKVVTNPETREGVYSIRFKLSFELEGHRNIRMKSIGHFTNEELEDAYRSTEDKDEEIASKNYNISELDVDGIIRESSISIKDPIPRWPQYALAGVTLLFSILAVYYYFKEDES